MTCVAACGARRAPGAGGSASPGHVAPPNTPTSGTPAAPPCVPAHSSGAAAAESIAGAGCASGSRGPGAAGSAGTLRTRPLTAVRQSDQKGNSGRRQARRGSVHLANQKGRDARYWCESDTSGPGWLSPDAARLLPPTRRDARVWRHPVLETVTPKQSRRQQRVDDRGQPGARARVEETHVDGVFPDRPADARLSHSCRTIVTRRTRESSAPPSCGPHSPL